MERVELAEGLLIPRIVTGLWQIADLERDGRDLDRAQAVDAMVPYFEAGLDAFDMADHYGSAELIAGEFRQREPDVRLLTKWVPTPGATTLEETREAVQRAQERLGVTQLDLLQFHAWRYSDATYLDSLLQLETLRAEGLLRHLGLTNVDTAHLRMLLETGIEIVSNQVCFSLLDRRPCQGMLELCRQRGVGLLAYGTLAGGFLTDRYLGMPEPDAATLETWSQMKYSRFLDVAGGWERLQRLLATLDRVAQRRGASIANVAVRWVLDQPGVSAVIVGARLGASEHIHENLRVLELELDADDVREIERAADELEPIPGDCGDEYRRPPFLTASGDLSHHVDKMPAPFATRKLGDRTLALSGTVWEDLAGFSRAVRVGQRVLVSGTTATHGQLAIGGSDPASQTHFVIDKLEGAIQSLGGELRDVVRTRIFVPPGADWEPVARAHGERFASVQPANTMVHSGVIGDEYLVEIEAEAIVPAD